MVVWTDYQCPACRQLEGELKELRQRLGDSLSVAYRFFPLPSHSLAFGAAVLAECAHRKGQFAAMHEALFHPALTGDSLPVDSLAARVAGANAKELRACSATREVRAIVDRERAIGDSLRFRGTPYVQIGDKLTFGGLPAGTLEQSLRSAR
jgi:protein-disulfide isomerase